MSDNTESTNLNTTGTNIVIEGLDSNIDYVFQVKAYTNKGSGPWSERLPFRIFDECKFEKLYFNIYYVNLP